MKDYAKPVLDIVAFSNETENMVFVSSNCNSGNITVTKDRATAVNQLDS